LLLIVPLLFVLFDVVVDDDNNPIPFSFFPLVDDTGGFFCDDMMTT
jgi:hypothetical protein